MAAAAMATSDRAGLHPWWVDSPRALGTLRRLAHATHDEWTNRRNNDWLGIIAVPLGMTATGLADQWWSWPLLLIDAACLTRAWRWSWILSLELAWVGTAWAYVGAVQLGVNRSHVLLVGLLWAAVAGALAGAGWLNRRHHALPEYQRLW